MLIRNELVYRLKADLYNYALFTGDDYAAKAAWAGSLGSYKTMLYRFWVRPDRFVVGRYADDFRNWRRDYKL